jgi:hypothetical protein
MGGHGTAKHENDSEAVVQRLHAAFDVAHRPHPPANPACRHAYRRPLGCPSSPEGKAAETRRQSLSAKLNLAAATRSAEKLGVKVERLAGRS